MQRKQEKETDDGTQKPEGKRARVRRLLLDPLSKDGFKKPAKISEEDFKKALGRLADALAYMSDQSLSVMYTMMRSKGQGRDRNIWPPRVTFYAIAELVEPCPLDKIPSLVGWFRSNAGPAAIDNDTLPEVLDYIQTHKKPPTSDSARKQIRHDAADRRHFVQIVRRQVQAGTASKDDQDKLRWLDSRHAIAMKLVQEGIDARKREGVA